ncbi:3'-5' exonuclease family protein [Roseibium marinum]|uniref:Exonuclease n=1 Tax=Roseibium marinum TaxID=281252 RepID=A0A2S3UYG3_9HYPH|nr:exonuclease [Roseibium marinum]POF32765.1 exonuclease [Roseibium marinum]
MPNAVIFDCEYLTAPGAMSRMWGGPLDPDPSVAQIGAVKLSLDPGHEIMETFQVLISPKDRYGRKTKPDPFFTELTGIDQASFDRAGVGLAEALHGFETFCGEATLWSWGKDELNLFAISCYVEGRAPKMPIQRFGNAAGLVFLAGMPYEDLVKTTSGQLASYFQLDREERREHDALDDAMSIAVSLQHLLRTGRLAPSDFRLPLDEADLRRRLPSAP